MGWEETREQQGTVDRGWDGLVHKAMDKTTRGDRTRRDNLNRRWTQQKAGKTRTARVTQRRRQGGDGTEHDEKWEGERERTGEANYLDCKGIFADADIDKYGSFPIVRSVMGDEEPETRS